MTKAELLDVIAHGELHLHLRRGGDKAEWMVTTQRGTICEDRQRCITAWEIRRLPRRLEVA